MVARANCMGNEAVGQVCVAVLGEDPQDSSVSQAPSFNFYLLAPLPADGQMSTGQCGPSKFQVSASCFLGSSTTINHAPETKRLFGYCFCDIETIVVQ